MSSTDRTSLHEGQERLAVVVEIRVQEDGTVAGSQGGVEGTVLPPLHPGRTG